MANAGSLQEQIQHLMNLVKETNNDTNLFFLTAFGDFRQMRITLEKLKENIDSKGTVLSDGRVNPCIAQYDKTAQASIALAEKLIKMINEMLGKRIKEVAKDEEEDEEEVTKKQNYSEYTDEELKLECRRYKLNYKGKKRKEVIQMLEDKINARFKWL